MAVRAGCCCSTYFYPRPPRGGRLQRARQRPARFFISIHALREEGDLLDRWEEYSLETFLSTPSARRATRLTGASPSSDMDFYPRPPRGGRPRLRVLDPFVLEISIHALREEGDDDPADDRIPIVVISIHALRATPSAPRPPRGGRHRARGTHLLDPIFLSTPSARRATNSGTMLRTMLCDFYPRPPRGGRLVANLDSGVPDGISIHALREEGDDHANRCLHPCADFYPRPPRGGRRTNRPLHSRRWYFYPRPPRGGRQLL